MVTLGFTATHQTACWSMLSHALEHAGLAFWALQPLRRSGGRSACLWMSTLQPARALPQAPSGGSPGRGRSTPSTPWTCRQPFSGRADVASLYALQGMERHVLQ